MTDIIRLILIIVLLITMFVNQIFENIYAEVSCGVLVVFLLIQHYGGGERNDGK